MVFLLNDAGLHHLSSTYSSSWVSVPTSFTTGMLTGPNKKVFSSQTDSANIYNVLIITTSGTNCKYHALNVDISNGSPAYVRVATGDITTSMLSGDNPSVKAS